MATVSPNSVAASSTTTTPISESWTWAGVTTTSSARRLGGTRRYVPCRRAARRSGLGPATIPYRRGRVLDDRPAHVAALAGARRGHAPRPRPPSGGRNGVQEGLGRQPEPATPATGQRR